MPTSSPTPPSPHGPTENPEDDRLATPPVAASARTRLAPSPTGALHLGNARTFLINWALARRRGWRILMRIEDLDGPRIKPEAEHQALDILAWLGLDWDEGPVRQSDDLEPYVAAMRSLAAAGTAYPSDLTRKQIEAAASAPQEGSGERRFPPELRPGDAGRARAFDNPRTNWRLLVAPGETSFDDNFAGAQTTDVHEDVGDFVIWTKRGQPAYQLAVVVDDARQGITEVVRGDDLLPSTARQALLHRALELDHALPRYTHLPLVLGPDGRRLAKRHGDTRLITFRDRGVTPERVVGLIASWSGVLPDVPRDMDASEFAERFDLQRLPREAVRLKAEDLAWLEGRP